MRILPDATVTHLDPRLLNFSGVNNVEVAGVIRNFGDAPANNVKVQLFWTREDEPPVFVGQQIIPVVPPGALSSVPLNFVAPGYAGTNAYRLVMDPDNALADGDRSNNTLLDHLFIQGLPDLLVEDVKATPQAPSRASRWRSK